MAGGAPPSLQRGQGGLFVCVGGVVNICKHERRSTVSQVREVGERRVGWGPAVGTPHLPVQSCKENAWRLKIR